MKIHDDVPRNVGKPDFGNLVSVLRRERPPRPTLFEFFLNEPLYRRLVGAPDDVSPHGLSDHLTVIRAFRNAGYDFATILLPDFCFPAGEVDQKETRSLNAGAVISDRSSFDSYPWPDPAAVDYSILDLLESEVPEGMKLIVFGPNGVLENAVCLVGFESLCYMISDDEQLAFDVFESIGSRLVEYYKRCAKHDVVGAIIGNDDWGFKTQTMLAPDDMRRFVFPWHKRIVSVAHEAGKPAILHSCGCLTSMMDDVIDDMKYDGKHSYEDTIQPIEDAYDQYHERIALLGGIDMDFVCRSTPEEVHKRSRGMLKRSEKSGAYALGTGNSVPEYVPDVNYFAMIQAALSERQAGQGANGT